jgi:hypothetical protein
MAAARRRGSTPITPLSASDRSIYRPASAGSAPRVVAPAAGRATPFGSPVTTEAYSSNFESNSSEGGIPNAY